MDMISIRRKLMAQSNPITINYVTDGLVLFLDGINKGSTVGAWTDLVGGHVFEQRESGTVVFGTDYVQFTSNIASYLRNSTFSTPSADVGTIEVVCEADNINRNACIYFSGEPDKLCLSRYMHGGNTPSYIWVRGSSKKQIVYGDYGSISISNNTKIINGISASVGPSNNLGNTESEVNIIGHRAGDNTAQWKFSGKIYCIRIYNRHLTRAEVLSNYVVDRSRFSLFN